MNAPWSAFIGDPDAIGWITVAAYLVAALACARAAGLSPRRHRSSRSNSRISQRSLWTGFMIVLLSLAINKQLDLQTLFTSALRQSARAEGWYGERRAYQLFFMEALAAAAVAGGVLLLWLTRRLGTGLKIASAGAIVLIAFVLMRAASFHHVDTLLRLEVGHLRLGWVIELGGIGLVTAGALRAQ